MRPPPRHDPPPLAATSAAALFDLEIAVVTPMFGGGATPQVTDALHPVRGSTVRGHLRFWWRACRAATYATADALFAAEKEIWGSTDTPSPTQVVVTTITAGSTEACARYVPSDRPGQLKTLPEFTSGYPGYALFPFQGKLTSDKRTAEQEPAQACKDMTFRLTVRAPAEYRADIEAALWAWLTFGGVGARTRRGCGSLFCKDALFAPPAQVAPLQAWLTTKAAQHVLPMLAKGTTSAIHIPLLSQASLVTAGSAGQPMAAWGSAVGKLQSFRQYPNGRPEPRDKSLWPDIASLRGAQASGYYPRADLGLPIVFQDALGSKETFTLEARIAGEDAASRMASPIIVKALALSPTFAVPIALALNAPHLWRVPGATVQVKDSPTRIPAAALTPKGHETPQPIARQQGITTARDAFMQFARTRDGWEVTL